LISVWHRSTLTQEQLVKQLNSWCQSAETSEIGALRDFSRQLRCYG
jgi:stearoyl-CoA desaturase (Delta-9 desaturase)